jgi:hypothetical protein
MKSVPALLAMALLACHLHAEPAPDSGLAAIPKRPDFREAETQSQITGLLSGELVGGLAAALIGASIGSKRAASHCREHIDPDFSDECGWAGLSGALQGMAIALPLGQALGTTLAGAMEGKRGNILITTAAAYAGDLALFFLATGLHNSLDGKVGPNGTLDPILIGVTGVAMATIPVAAYTLSDYHVRFPLRPSVEPGKDLRTTRVSLQILQAHF